MKSKLRTTILLAALITATSIVAQPGAMAASSSICNSVSCDNPQQSTVFGGNQDRPLNRPAPVTVCTVLNNWKVDAVIQVVGGLLKVNWVYTLVPSVICHLVG
jgi:hypothetical protein